VESNATQTTFVAQTPDARVQLTLRLQSSNFARDFLYLSRPVAYADLTVVALDGQSHAVQVLGRRTEAMPSAVRRCSGEHVPQVYLDFSAEHVCRSTTQQVEWSSFVANRSPGVRMGVHGQV
jgi:hypothetical protein